MKRIVAVGIGCLLAALCLVQPWARAEKSERNNAVEKPPAKTESAASALKPGPNDGRIAYVTAQLLERHHYSQHPFDDVTSSNLLDRYVRDLDFQHMHFLQSDLADFEGYRYRLDDLILKRGDTTPAYVIFAMFLKRLEQHVAYVEELLKTEKFTFDTNERVALNRRDLPFPKDLDEAKQLWRDRLRSEYLQEKLNQPNPDEVAKLILDKLNQKKPGEILASIRDSQAKEAAQKAKETSQTNDMPESAEVKVQNDITLALKGKVSDDRANKIAAFIEPMLTKQKPEAIARAVAVKVAADNAEEIVTTLTKRNNRLLKTFKDWDSDNVLEIYLTSLTHVYDPHSDYLGKSQLESFKISMNLALFGIGAELRSEDGYCKITKLLPGPAAKSKRIKVGDRIVAVAQGDAEPVDIVEMPLNKAVQLIRGPKGSLVRVTVIPVGADSSARKTVSLVRDEIKLEDQEAKGKIIELPAAGGGTMRLGVIDLPSFYAPMSVGSKDEKAEARWTSVDVAKLLKKFKEEKVSGVILDLRHNGGGSLDEAIKLTGLFIKDGPVVQVRDPDGEVQVDEDRDSAVTYDGPLLVLTSKFSASASEIAAGALQDYGRALVVGDASTHGKGTVQSVNSLEPFMKSRDDSDKQDPGALKMTIRKFYRASGASTQLKGVTPDIVLPSIWNVSKDIGEDSLDYRLQWDTIPGAKFDHQDRVEPYLEELRKRETGRLAAEKDYQYVREDIEQFAKLQADKTVSLNEKQRLKEKDEAEARKKTREKELMARKATDETVYEIPLKVADKPGLPAPVSKTNSPALAKDGHPDVKRAGTNAVAAIAIPVGPSVAADPDDAEDEQIPTVDVVLNEAEHILVDYLSLLPKETILTINEPAVRPGGKPGAAGNAGSMVP